MVATVLRVAGIFTLLVLTGMAALVDPGLSQIQKEGITERDIAAPVHPRDRIDGGEAVYFEDWDSGLLDGWEAGTPGTVVSATDAGGQPLGHLSVTRVPGNTSNFAVRTRLPEATGDLAAKGVANITFDLIWNGRGDWMWVRLQPQDDATPGWLYPIHSEATGTWYTRGVRLDPSWSDYDAIQAGWARQLGAPSFPQTIHNIHSVGLVFQGSEGLTVGVDNFRTGTHGDCHPDLPDPVVLFESKHAGNPGFTDYELDVANWSAYPAEYFVPAPHLPPCGGNPMSSRAWVYIYRANGDYIYGFCGLQSPAQLRNIWFWLPFSETPPDIYVEIWDRECDIVHRSKVISTAAPNRLPIASAGRDQVVECAGVGGTPVQLNGAGSYDPEHVPLTFSWSAPGITFDDPTSPRPTGVFPRGETEVWLQVSDGVYEARDMVKVRVEHKVAPSLDVQVAPAWLWPPNHKLVDIHATVRVEDACDASPAFVLAGITWADGEGRPVGGPAGPDVVGADLGTADLDFQLRAGRPGSGEGRRYRIVYRATDVAGNATEREAFVLVPHDRGGKEPVLPDAGKSSEPAAELALFGARSNPSTDGLSVSFSLPDASPALLEVLDPSGRRVTSRQVGAMGPGRHVVALEEARALPAGIYLLRLRHGPRTLVVKAALVR